MLITALTGLLAGCVFTENETTACPYCGAEITAEEAGDHRIPGCGVAEHAICVVGPGEEHEKCEICGGPLCTGNHNPAGCGTADHFMCDGKVHASHSCSGTVRFRCDGLDHSEPDCDVPGHCEADGRNHDNCNNPMSSASAGGSDTAQPTPDPVAETCPTCLNPLDNGQDHGATDCHFKSTHRHCDGMEHDRCDICRGWLCNGSTHAPGICNVTYIEVAVEAEYEEEELVAVPIFVPCPRCQEPLEDGDEHAAPCGEAAHYTCDDKSHGTASCGHGPACTIDYSRHALASCRVHFICTDVFITDDHDDFYGCNIHSLCDVGAASLDHHYCTACGNPLCSDAHSIACS